MHVGGPSSAIYLVHCAPVPGLMSSTESSSSIILDNRADVAS